VNITIHISKPNINISQGIRVAEALNDVQGCQLAFPYASSQFWNFFPKTFDSEKFWFSNLAFLALFF